MILVRPERVKFAINSLFTAVRCYKCSPIGLPWHNVGIRVLVILVEGLPDSKEAVDISAAVLGLCVRHFEARKLTRGLNQVSRYPNCLETYLRSQKMGSKADTGTEDI